jgi:outer membrane protein
MKRMFVWLMACIFINLSVQSQETPVAKTPGSFSLSLDQAKEYALEHNTSIIKSGLSLREAEQSKWAVIANYLPQVSASASYNNYMGTKLEILGQSIPMNPSSTLTIQATQALFNMNIIVGTQLAEIARQMSQNAVQQTELAIKQSVNLSYYSILVSEENKNILEKNLANIRVLAKATHIKVSVGIGEQTEADQIDITVANLENTLQSTERNIEMAYNSMRLLLGIGAEEKLTLTSRLSELTDKTNSFDLLVKPFDVDNNIDMKTSKLSVDLSEKQLKSSIYSCLPSLTAVFQHNELLLKSGFDFTMKNTLVVSANIPLFTSGKNYANVKKAKLALRSSQLDNELAKDQLLIQEKQLRYNLKSAQNNYDIQKKNIEVSQRVFDNITKKYEQGLSSSLELTTANNNLLTAQSNYIGSVMTLLNAQDSLQKLLGTL